jgi:hypothetical protein
MSNKGIATRTSPLKSLFKGFLISTGLSILLYPGISLTYNYLPESILLMIAITIICFLVFWINIKYDEIYDRIDVYAKTISFDYRFSHPKLLKVFHFMRPINPYIGAAGTILLLLCLILSLPALIIYWAVDPAQYETALKTGVFIMSTFIGILYFFSSRDVIISPINRIMFFTGILLGPVGAFKVLS